MGVAVAHSTSMTTCRSLRKDILQLILTTDLLIECSAMIFLQLFAEDAPVVSGPVENFLGIASSFLPLELPPPAPATCASSTVLHHVGSVRWGPRRQPAIHGWHGASRPEEKCGRAGNVALTQIRIHLDLGRQSPPSHQRPPL